MICYYCDQESDDLKDSACPKCRAPGENKSAISKRVAQEMGIPIETMEVKTLDVSKIFSPVPGYHGDLPIIIEDMAKEMYLKSCEKFNFPPESWGTYRIASSTWYYAAQAACQILGVDYKWNEEPKDD